MPARACLHMMALGAWQAGCNFDTEPATDPSSVWPAGEPVCRQTRRWWPSPSAGERFRGVLGTSAQLEKIMAAEKSPAVVTTRLMRLQVIKRACVTAWRLQAAHQLLLVRGSAHALLVRHAALVSEGQQQAPAQAKGMPPHMPATVLLKRRRKGKTPNDSWEVVRARGHLDEVQALRSSSAAGALGCLAVAAKLKTLLPSPAAPGPSLAGVEKQWQAVAYFATQVADALLLCADDSRPDGDALVLTEGAVLGGGAFSRVSIVTGTPCASSSFPCVI